MFQRRSRRRRARRLILVAATSLAAASCTSSNGDAPPPAMDSSEPQAVTIVADDYVFTEAPAELPAGAIDLTFDNQDRVEHEVGVAGIGDTPLETFLEDLRDGAFGLEPRPSPTYLDQVAVPIFGQQGGTAGEATFTLTPGRYMFFCSMTSAARGDDEVPHYERGMIRELVVSGGDQQPVLPTAEGTITVFDYGYRFDLQPGDRVVNFVNEGPNEIHYTSVELYPKGVTAEEAEDFYAAQLEGDAGAGIPSPKGIGWSGIYSAGLGSTFEVDGGFKLGRTYVFACFVQDRAGGKPHAIAYDMYEAVTIE